MPGHSYTRTEPTTPPVNTVAGIDFMIGYLRGLSESARDNLDLNELDREVLRQAAERLQELRPVEGHTPLPTHNEGSFA